MFVVAFGLVVAGCDGGSDSEDDDGEEGVATCEHDEANSPDQAVALGVGESGSGFICPEGDEDWYEVETESERSILGVSLEMSTELTGVSPTYAIWSTEEGQPDEVVATPPSDTSGKALELEHCLGRGTYKMVVRDRGNDDADLRHPYNLEVTASEDPDTAEPNDSPDQADELEPGTPTEGYVACRGDVDWYAFDVPEDRLVRYRLTADEPNFQPRVALYSEGGERLLSEGVEEGSPRVATDIDRLEVVPGAGRYYLAVSDDDDGDSDASVPYEVQVELIESSDPNEPNNSPQQATEIAEEPLECGSSWTEEFKDRGAVDSPNDTDWFKVPLQGCDGGILEAKAELRTGGLDATEQWDINEEVALSTTMVRPDSESPCQADEECTALQRSCDVDTDCAGYLETCLSEGLCQGSGRCLPEQQCGAAQIQRHYRCSEHLERCQRSSERPPPPNRAEFAAPLFGEEVAYLRVENFLPEGSAPEKLYRLRVRVRKDPDEHEPNNFYTSTLQEERSFPPTKHRERAKRIPVYDCTGQAQSGHLDGGLDGGGSDTAIDADGDGVLDASADTGSEDTAGPVDSSSPEDTAGGEDTGGAQDTGGGGMDTGPDLPQGCCANQEWVQGNIAYENDLDWFEYVHPCPGEDCTLKIHYRTDAGPVDHVAQVYLGDELWSTALESEEREMHDAKEGSFGGSTEQDRCHYAYHDHSRDDGRFYYGLLVRDFRDLFEDGHTVKPGTRDWSAEQSYSLCVEKISDQCLEPPCKVYEEGPGGCGQP